MSPKLLLATALVGGIAIAFPAAAQTPADFLARFEREARQDNPAFGGFSAAAGQRFFTARHGAEWSCSSCHTDTPAQPGRHAKTAKAIEPLAPAANPRRFTDTAKVDKWFKRNCGDVLGRACTAQEKGDVLTWLTSAKAQGGAR